MIVHICPVCGEAHEIPEILHRLAYGRQLTCSPHCKSRWPAVIRARTLAEMAIIRQHSRHHSAAENSSCSSIASPIKTAAA